MHWSVRHLEAAFDVLTFTDKVPHTYSLGAQRNRDVLEMTRIARQVDDATLEREPSVFTVVNSSSPLRLDAPMLHGHHRAVVAQPGRRDDAVHAGRARWRRSRSPARSPSRTPRRSPAWCSPRSCGPARPSSTAGSRRNVDMQSGAPAFGTPEYVRTAMLGGQLARRYRVPYRSSNVYAANAARRPGRLRERVLAVGRGDGRRQLPDARRRVDGGRAAGVARQVRARRRPAGDGRRAARPDRRRRRHAGARRHPRGRPGRPLLRRRATPSSASAPRSTGR